MPLAENSSPAPNSRTLDWGALAKQAWGPSYYEPDVVYTFSNNREFKSTDGTDHGFYDT